MPESHILLLEFISTIFFSIEYFLYKKEINYINNLINININRSFYSSKRHYIIQKFKLKKNIKYYIIRIFISITILIIIYKIMLLYKVYTMNEIMLLSTLLILSIIYVAYAFYHFIFHTSGWLRVVLFATFKKFLYIVKKGALVAIGLILLLLSFVGKFLNMYGYKFDIIELVSYISISVSILVLLFFLSSHIKLKNKIDIY